MKRKDIPVEAQMPALLKSVGNLVARFATKMKLLITIMTAPRGALLGVQFTLAPAFIC